MVQLRFNFTVRTPNPCFFPITPQLFLRLIGHLLKGQWCDYTYFPPCRAGFLLETGPGVHWVRGPSCGLSGEAHPAQLFAMYNHTVFSAGSPTRPLTVPLIPESLTSLECYLLYTSFPHHRRTFSAHPTLNLLSGPCP